MKDKNIKQFMHAKRRTLMVGEGLMKSVKMNMVDVLSICI
jgi:hypothetical protein